MLSRLQVRNYAIIEEVELQLTQGLNIITGETGAGKSILLGALGLIMGKRADTKSLLDKEKKCVIEATFQVPQIFQNFFEKNDIDYEKETIIRREITPSGKSRAFVNDTPTNLKVLKFLTSTLVDLHQQFDTLDIHNVSFQINVLDALAEQKEEVDEYRKQFKQYSKDKKQLSDLMAQNDEAAKEMDFLQFQLSEFNEVEIIENEEEELEVESKTLSHAEDIKRVLGATHQHLIESETALVGQIKDLMFELSNISNYSADAEKIRQRFEGIVAELEDLGGELETTADKTVFDPERMSEIRERLDAIYRLQNKHRVSTTIELLEIQNQIEEKLASFQDMGQGIIELEQKIAKQEAQLQKLALRFSKNRKKITASFEKSIKDLLAQLSMPHARLVVKQTTNETLNQNGLDEIQFLFAANKGGEPQAIKDVASGGELARLNLCIKSLVADALALPTMIFDEIDTGVSGDVALKMGGILKRLAQGHQIISITHTPQIAVQADTHYYIYKDHAGQRTKTQAKLLEKESRVEEIATMLSGSPPSSSALDNARELLKG